MIARCRLMQAGSRAHGSRVIAATFALSLLSMVPTSSQPAQFRIEEATIADIHHAILARQLTATQLVTAYLKRIEAYNGRCVNGAVDTREIG